MMEVNKQLINGKRVFAFLSRTDFLKFIDKRNSILVALNAEKLNKTDEKLNRLINENIGYADGVGTVWALKKKGINSVKIPGAEFWLDIISYYQMSKSFYFIGASQEVIEQTIDKLKKEFPKINIKGFRNGFLEQGDREKLISEFQDLQPDVIFVAMGSPRQEYLMEDFLKRYPALYMGLGGSFDVYAGLKKRAPLIFQKMGLEWFYRLLKEPTRWRRQLTYISFSLKVISNKI
ncbi:WecB/TagA/CpsF family glycosyltransferase [Flagellimonas sp. 2504JD4-2]